MWTSLCSTRRVASLLDVIANNPSRIFPIFVLLYRIPFFLWICKWVVKTGFLVVQRVLHKCYHLVLSGYKDLSESCKFLIQLNLVELLIISLLIIISIKEYSSDFSGCRFQCFQSMQFYLLSRNNYPLLVAKCYVFF